jgi:Sec-independent protein secretion pathway component TatC
MSLSSSTAVMRTARSRIFIIGQDSPQVRQVPDEGPTEDFISREHPRSSGQRRDGEPRHGRRRQTRMSSPAEPRTPSWPRRLGIAVLGIAVATVVGWFFVGLVWDLLNSSPSHRCACTKSSVTAAFSAHLRLALIFGLAGSSPVWLRQLGVRRRTDLLAAVLLFAAGAVLTSVSLRHDWWLGYGQGQVVPLVTVDTILDQALVRLLVLGLLMELPLTAVIALRGRVRGARA